ncbi:MAG: choice-of-anchor B family protein [Bacteroidetes bacterium]|nr:choice-of-anchor B family protein [Bacteroidota bacterium]
MTRTKLRHFAFATSLLVLTSLSLLAQKNLSLLGHLTYSTGVKCSNLTSYVDSGGREYALVGNTEGLSIVRIDTPTNPKQIFLIPGATGTNAMWREVREYKGYAYVTTEQASGLMVVDLRYLPDSVRYHTVKPGNMTTSHSIFIDEKGIAYINGTDKGQLFLKLDSNLWSPPLIGSFQNNYVHDNYARNDTMWNACVNNGFIKVVDVRNKSTSNQAANTLAVWNTPQNFAHNCWLSDDSKYLFTTDEKPSSYLTCYDVSNLGSVRETARSKSVDAGTAIMHNTYFKNNYAVSSYYTYGIAIFDVLRKNNLVEVAHYDTSPTTGSSFNGAWGVWPFLPSGNIIVSDIENGLWILKPEYKRACYVEGIVKDSLCGTLLNDVTVEIVGTSASVKSNLQGIFAMGTPDTGTYTIRFSKSGYQTRDSSNVALRNGSLKVININLIPINTSRLTVLTTDSATSDSLPFVRVLIQDTLGATYQEVATNNFAQYNFCDFLQGKYNFYAGRWGRQTVYVQAVDSTSIDTVLLPTSKGYYDDFIMDYGWTTQTTASSGAWKRGKPIGTTYFLNTANPGADVSGDFGNQCYVTGNNGGDSGDDDVDDGYTILRSPLFAIRDYDDPHITYSRWFYNDGGSTTPNDSLVITLTNGIDSVTLDVETTSRSQWVDKDFRVKDYLAPTSNMRIAFKAEDRSPGHLVEAGLDVFSVYDIVDTTKGDTATVSVSSTSGDKVLLHVYPNPFQDKVNISITDFPFENGTLEIEDALGRRIHQSLIQAKNSLVRLDIRLASGIYLVKLLKQGQLIQSQKIVRTE